MVPTGVMDVSAPWANVMALLGAPAVGVLVAVLPVLVGRDWLLPPLALPFVVPLLLLPFCSDRCLASEGVL